MCGYGAKRRASRSRLGTGSRWVSGFDFWQDLGRAKGDMDDSAKGQQAAGIDGSIDGHSASGLVYEVETEIIYMLAAVGRLPLFRDLSVETL